MSQESQSKQPDAPTDEPFREGRLEQIEAWGRSHGGLLAILALAVAIATVSGVVFGAFADVWRWVYAREWATLALVGVLVIATVVSTYRMIKLRGVARRAVRQADSAARPGPYNLEASEAKQRLDGELAALQRMVEAAGLNVTWQPDWRFRIRRSGGRERNLFTLELTREPNKTRAAVRAKLRECEQALREEGVRISPALLTDPE